MKIHSGILSNKTKYQIITSPCFTQANIRVGFKVGSINEDADITGCSHFLEHLLFKGTKKYPSPEILANEIEKHGGTTNAYTGKEITSYYIDIANNKIQYALEILSQMIWFSLFDIEEINRERGVVIEEMNIILNNPAKFTYESIDRILHRTPYYNNILGTKASIKNISRVQIVDYYTKLYTPSNMIVTVAGNVDYLKSKQLIHKYFSYTSPSIPNHQSSNYSYNPGTYTIQHQNEPLKYIIYSNKPQIEIALYWKIDTGYGHPNENIYSVISSVLGDGLSSRLFILLREKLGIAYKVNSDIILYKDQGIFYILAGVKKEKCLLAINKIKEVILDLQNNGITEFELNKAKESLINSWIVSSNDSEHIGDYYNSTLILENKQQKYNEYIKEIKKISLKNVNKIAKKLFSNKMWSTIYGIKPTKSNPATNLNIF